MYNISSIPPAIQTGVIGRIVIRSDNDIDSSLGINYGETIIEDVGPSNRFRVRGVIPATFPVQSTFYVIVQLNQAAAAYVVSFDEGIALIERDLVGSIPSELSLIHI